MVYNSGFTCKYLQGRESTKDKQVLGCLAQRHRVQRAPLIELSVSKVPGKEGWVQGLGQPAGTGWEPHAPLEA